MCFNIDTSIRGFYSMISRRRCSSILVFERSLMLRKERFQRWMCYHVPFFKECARNLKRIWFSSESLRQDAQNFQRGKTRWKSCGDACWVKQILGRKSRGNEQGEKKIEFMGVGLKYVPLSESLAFFCSWQKTSLTWKTLQEKSSFLM